MYLSRNRHYWTKTKDDAILMFSFQRYCHSHVSRTTVLTFPSLCPSACTWVLLLPPLVLYFVSLRDSWKVLEGTYNSKHSIYIRFLALYNIFARHGLLATAWCFCSGLIGKRWFHLLKEWWIPVFFLKVNTHLIPQKHCIISF